MCHTSDFEVVQLYRMTSLILSFVTQGWCQIFDWKHFDWTGKVYNNRVVKQLSFNKI